MSDPVPYSRTYSFTDYQAGNPSAPLPGIQVDNELENVEQSLGEAIDAIKDVRRSDGKLKNGIVTVDSLSPQVAAGVGTGALASAAAAAASADAASDSAVAAAASATAASGSATAASGYASNALTSRNEASGFADDSAAAASLSQTARDYASKWATEAEGVDVDDGVNPVGKSAYHWAQVALDAAAGSIADGAVTTAKLADGALSADSTGRAKMADGFVTSAKIADGTIATGDVADGAITSAKIGANQVTPDKQAGEHFRGFINGLTLSNNATDATNDIDISAGSAGSDGATPVLMSLSSALTKRLDAAWAVGSGNGGLDTGSIANTTYHVWLIQRSDTGVVDALFSTSATSPTMPTKYDRKRRIGSIVRAGGTILPFTQNGDEFLWMASQDNTNNANPGTPAVLQPLTVPTGIKVIVKFNAIVRGGAAAANFLFSSPDQTDTVPSGIANYSITGPLSSSGQLATGQFTERTNTSGQIRVRTDFSDPNVFVRISTKGYVDGRGRV